MTRECNDGKYNSKGRTMSEEIIMKLPLFIVSITALTLCFGWYTIPLLFVIWFVSGAMARTEE